MNKEDLKKNYILLSKIAKEKKYAQEYLGLLARRGDIGSIRIGKRWYTTKEWFAEFLQDAKGRKEGAEQSIVVEKIAIEKKPDCVSFSGLSGIALPLQKTEVAIEGNVRHTHSRIGILNGAKEEKVAVIKSIKEERGAGKDEALRIVMPTAARSSSPVQQENFAIQAKRPSLSRSEMKSSVIDLRNLEKTHEQVQEKEHIIGYRNTPATKEYSERGTEVAQTIKEVDAYWDYELRRNNSILSPAFLKPEQPGMAWFPRLAFGFSFVLLFFLLFQGAFIYRKDIMKLAGLEKGIVAGVSDERKNSLADVRLAADYYIKNQENQMKESVSLSQLMLRAALEKEKSNEEIK